MTTVTSPTLASPASGQRDAEKQALTPSLSSSSIAITISPHSSVPSTARDREPAHANGTPPSSGDGLLRRSSASGEPSAPAPHRDRDWASPPESNKRCNYGVNGNGFVIGKKKDGNIGASLRRTLTEVKNSGLALKKSFSSRRMSAGGGINASRVSAGMMTRHRRSLSESVRSDEEVFLIKTSLDTDGQSQHNQHYNHQPQRSATLPLSAGISEGALDTRFSFIHLP